MKKPELLIDLGMRYPTKDSKEKKRYGLYRCSCGKEFETQIADVRNGHTKSCGCYSIKRTIETKTIHGFAKHPLYGVWSSMIDRTTNQKNTNYKHYGDRGITVCDRWMDIKNFIKDMYPSYQEGLTLDRINNNGNYEPNNCRWTIQTVQTRNTRKLKSNNTSGYRGVSFYKTNKRWVAQIKVNPKNIKLGYHNTSLEAANAYDMYVVTHNLEHTINNVLFCNIKDSTW